MSLTFLYFVGRLTECLKWRTTGQVSAKFCIDFMLIEGTPNS
jgi:hypothetical protein